MLQKKLKRWNYRAHYYEKLSEAELEEEGVHTGKLWANALQLDEAMSLTDM
jgi:hypothetical protein